MPVMLDTEMPCLVCKWTCRDKKEDVVLEKCRTKGDKGVSQWIKVALLSVLQVIPLTTVENMDTLHFTLVATEPRWSFQPQNQNILD